MKDIELKGFFKALIFACLALHAAACLSGCQTAQLAGTSRIDQAAPVARQTSTSDEDSIREVIQGVMLAYNRRDGDALAARYSLNATVHVTSGGGYYVMDKQSLLRAFEMKKKGWDGSGLRFTGYEIENLNIRGDEADVDIVFEVVSAKWSGDYETRMTLRRFEDLWLIVSENAP